MLTMITFYIFKFAKQIYLMYYMDVRQFGLDQLTENVIWMSKLFIYKPGCPILHRNPEYYEEPWKQFLSFLQGPSTSLDHLFQTLQD